MKTQTETVRCHPYSHDFHHSATCRNCESPREDRLPSEPYRTRHTNDGEELRETPRLCGAYETHLAYGGPEEGGWYETLYHHLASMMIRPDENPLSVARTLWDAFSDRDDGREISSVLATGAVVIMYEDVPGEHSVNSVGRYC